MGVHGSEIRGSSSGLDVIRNGGGIAEEALPIQLRPGKQPYRVTNELLLASSSFISSFERFTQAGCESLFQVTRFVYHNAAA